MGMLCNTNEEGPPLGVRGEVLPRHDASATRLPEGLAVHHFPRSAVRIELNNRDLPRVRSDNEVVLIST
jgi:hypothetical protein